MQKYYNKLMDNKILQHKLKCKLCQNKIKSYDVQLYCGLNEFEIYAQIQKDYNITFETMKEHKLFITEFYTEKELLNVIKDYDFDITDKRIKEEKLNEKTKYMQSVCNNILWEEIPVLINKIIQHSKTGKISAKNLVIVLDKLLTCSKNIGTDEIALVGSIESGNDEAGKREDMGGLTQQSFEEMIEGIKRANEILDD